MVLPKSMRKEWLLMEIASIWGLLRHRVCHCKFRPRSCSLVMRLENKWNLLVLPLHITHELNIMHFINTLDVHCLMSSAIFVFAVQYLMSSAKINFSTYAALLRSCLFCLGLCL
jgi:hypothetical protein